MYDGQEYVYTFHADAPAKMLLLGSNLEKKRKSAQVSGQQPMVFASVIGGLSGINLLAEAWLPDPDEIILYDMNPWILEYARLVVELIGTSTSREDYISRLFSRRLSDFLATKNVTELSPETEHAFLDLSIDTALTQQTSEALTNTSRCVFAWVTHTLMEQPHRSTPPPAPRRVCERVQLFHDPNRAPKLDVGLVHSGKCLAHVSAHQCKQRINTCTLYLGHGWLRSESTFSRVRARLNAARVRYVQWNVMQPLDQLYAAGAGDQPADTVLYTSNINAFLKKGLWSQTLASWRSQIASWRGASLFVAALNEDVTAITSPRAPADASASLVATSPLLSSGRSGKPLTATVAKPLESTATKVAFRAYPPPPPSQPVDLHGLRSNILSTIWEDGKLPLRSTPDEIESASDEPSLHRLTWSMRTKFVQNSHPLQKWNGKKFFSRVYHSFALARTQSNTAVLFHHGHEAHVPSTLSRDGEKVWQTSLPWWRRIYDFHNLKPLFHDRLSSDAFFLYMPLLGHNAVNGTPGYHSLFKRLQEARGDKVLRYFIEPIVLTINHAFARGYKNVMILGFSGGGWCATIAAGMDARIQATISIAGTSSVSPQNMYTDFEYWTQPKNNDWYLTHAKRVLARYDLHNQSGYLALYALAVLEKGRLSLQLMHDADVCCFTAGPRQHAKLRHHAMNISAMLSAEKHAGCSPEVACETHGVFSFAVTRGKLHAVNAYDRALIITALKPLLHQMRSSEDLRPQHLMCDLLYVPNKKDPFVTELSKMTKLTEPHQQRARPLSQFCECSDVAEWRSMQNISCAWYTRNPKSCNGFTTKSIWGSKDFDQRSSPSGVHPTAACCACGGGEAYAPRDGARSIL